MRTEFIIEFEKMISDFINTHYKPEGKIERNKALKELRDHLNGWIEFIEDEDDGLTSYCIKHY